VRVCEKKAPSFEMLDSLPSTTATTSRRRISAARFSRATARSIRQAVAIATELELHSVAIAGCVWTIRHSRQEQQQQPRQSRQQQQQQLAAQGTAPRETRTLRRKRRDDERAAAHRARRDVQAPEPVGEPSAREAHPHGEPAEERAPQGTAQQQQQVAADAASPPPRAAATVREGPATAVQSPGAQPKKRGLPRRSPASAKRAARTPTLPPPATGGSLFDELMAEVSTVPPSLPPSPPPPSTSPPTGAASSAGRAKDDPRDDKQGDSPRKYTTREDFVARFRITKGDEEAERLWALFSGGADRDRVYSQEFPQFLRRVKEYVHMVTEQRRREARTRDA
jgi:hypothetical protein